MSALSPLFKIENLRIYYNLIKMCDVTFLTIILSLYNTFISLKVNLLYILKTCSVNHVINLILINMIEKIFKTFDIYEINIL